MIQAIPYLMCAVDFGTQLDTQKTVFYASIHENNSKALVISTEICIL
jgi:hypothetical protein